MIEVRSLTKHYGTTVAVDGLSFQVPAGRRTLDASSDRDRGARLARAG